MARVLITSSYGDNFRAGKKSVKDLEISVLAAEEKISLGIAAL
jgi:hypothetical protein